jgi:dTDP-4-dehydrorhamnose 3,5-epimerase
MRITPTKIKDVLVLEPKVFEDKRGFFFESFREDVFKQRGFNYLFVQDNHSRSSQNVLRGLHYQIEPKAQAKLVRIVVGEIFDVAVDIRQESPTFGQWVGEILSAKNKKQLFVPRGFAHGFCVLSDTAEMEYKCTEYYSPEHERGIRWNDPKLNINWPVKNPILSEKDKNLPLLKEQKDLF